MLGFSNYNYRHFSRDILREMARAPLQRPGAGRSRSGFQGHFSGWRNTAPE